MRPCRTAVEQLFQTLNVLKFFCTLRYVDPALVCFSLFSVLSCNYICVFLDKFDIASEDYPPSPPSPPL